MAIVCSGADNIRRGYEMYARDLFEMLRSEQRFDAVLIKGSGARRPDEIRVFNLSRGSLINRLICRFVGERWKYYIEYVSFAAGMLPLLLRSRFDAIYVLDAPLYKFLFAFRHRFRASYKLIHFTGGQLRSLPLSRSDFLHHVTPAFIDHAIRDGWAPENQFLVPHFLPARTTRQQTSLPDRGDLRASLRIPAGRRVVLSVGHIDTQVKRMDYVIEECAALSTPVFLLLVGEQEPESERVIALGTDRLGWENFLATSAAPEEMWRYYSVADVFTLASLREGFGLVFLEALAAGLPVIAHDYDVTRYVLREQGIFVDMTRKGELRAALAAVLKAPVEAEVNRARQRYVAENFGRDTLAVNYVRMFEEVCGIRQGS